MKTSSKILLSAAFAAAALSACSRESLEPSSAQRGNLTEVLFGADAAEIVLQSKASLTTEDEKNFKSAWTEGDALSVEYSFNGGTPATAPTTWNGSAFSASLPDGTGSWSYSAVYPSPDSEGKTDFGSARTQNGNAYNSKYDLMKGSVAAEGAAAGKTAGGENIVFPMDRQTAIAYFHLTGSLEEKLVSAKLSVEGGRIATSSAKVSSYSDGYGFFSSDDAAPLTEITLTFDEGTAPKASDCRLWFNVIPTQYTKMTLKVETASHSLTISRTPPTGTDEYVAGNLYEVVKEIPSDKWTVKTSAEPLSLTFNFVTFPDGWPKGSGNAKAGSYNYTLDGVTYTFTHSTSGDGIYCGGTSTTSGYLLVAKGEMLGLPAISGYKLTKVVGTLNGNGNPSEKSEVSITDGSSVLSGGAAQTWSAKGSSYTYSLADTKECEGYYLAVSSEANCQIVTLALSYESAPVRTVLQTPSDLAVSSEKTVSWTAVDGAASYKVAIGENTYVAATNSYDASALEDEYYDVAVAAVPSKHRQL